MAERGQFNQCGLKQRAGSTRSLSGRSTCDDGYPDGVNYATQNRIYEITTNLNIYISQLII